MSTETIITLAYLAALVIAGLVAAGVNVRSRHH